MEEACCTQQVTRGSGCSGSRTGDQAASWGSIRFRPRQPPEGPPLTPATSLLPLLRMCALPPSLSPV